MDLPDITGDVRCMVCTMLDTHSMLLLCDLLGDLLLLRLAVFGCGTKAPQSSHPVNWILGGSGAIFRYLSL